MYNDEPEIKEKKGVHLIETGNRIVSKTSDYLQLSDVLYQFPWRIYNQNIQKQLFNHFNKLINSSNGITIQEKIKSKIEDKFTKATVFDFSYPFLFINKSTFNVNINKSATEHEILFALGKRQNGLYHVLSPQGMLINFPGQLLEFVVNYKIKNIHALICDFINQGALFSKSDYKSILILSLSSLLNQIKCKSLSEQKHLLTNLQLSNIDSIFRQQTKKDAGALLLYYSKLGSKYDKLLLNRLRFSLQNIKALYNYPLNTRLIICTNNIIHYLHYIISILLENRDFQNNGDAARYITLAANEIINNGHELIPNWEKLIIPVK
jgi:hypothetical protein